MPEVCASCVLLVDNDLFMREVISSHLEDWGLQAIHAEDGIDAIVKLRDTLPKVIISDLEMPRMSGIEFVGIVRRRFPNIPVVALSGYIAGKFPTNIKPDCWFEKSMLWFPELSQTVSHLARRESNRVDLPQAISFPVRPGPGGDGYFALTCTECLRSFEVTGTPGHTKSEPTDVCTHCQACVPFFIENSQPE